MDIETSAPSTPSHSRQRSTVSSLSSTPNYNYSPMDISFSPYPKTPLSVTFSPTPTNGYDILSFFPEEILITVLSYLSVTDLFNCKHVDSFYTQKRIPTLDELQKYTGVLVYSYNSSAFQDGQLMGDVLADYVDNGGGVVVTVFTNCNNLRNGFLKGRFCDQNYHPINPARQHDTNGKKPLTLGKVHHPGHPIMNGVKSLEGGRSSFFCPGSLHPEAKLVAEWSNNMPLIVDLTKNKGKVVALNFFPPSSDTGDARFWSANTDGSLMMANALAYVGNSAALKKYKSQTEGASFYNDKLKDGEGASNHHTDKDLYLSNKNKQQKDKKHRFLGKRIPLLFKLFSKRLTPI
eukprot:gene20358-24423_t